MKVEGNLAAGTRAREFLSLPPRASRVSLTTKIPFPFPFERLPRRLAPQAFYFSLTAFNKTDTYRFSPRCLSQKGIRMDPKLGHYRNCFSYGNLCDTAEWAHWKTEQSWRQWHRECWTIFMTKQIFFLPGFYLYPTRKEMVYQPW